jgi:hypothetical protein
MTATAILAYVLMFSPVSEHRSATPILIFRTESACQRIRDALNGSSSTTPYRCTVVATAQ